MNRLPLFIGLSFFRRPSSGDESLQPKGSSLKSESKITALFQTVRSTLKYVWECLMEASTNKKPPKEKTAKAGNSFNGKEVIILTPKGGFERYYLHYDKRKHFVKFDNIAPAFLENYCFRLFTCDEYLKSLLRRNAPIGVRTKDIAEIYRIIKDYHDKFISQPRRPNYSSTVPVQNKQ